MAVRVPMDRRRRHLTFGHRRSPFSRIPISSVHALRADRRGVHRRPVSRLRGAPAGGAGPLRRGDRPLADLPVRDVDALLRDRRFGRTYLHMATHEEMGRPTPPEWHSPFWDLINAGILDMEPPDHTRVRKLVSKAFTPKFVERFARACRRSSTDSSTGSRIHVSSTCCPPWPSRCRSSSSPRCSACPRPTVISSVPGPRTS